MRALSATSTNLQGNDLSERDKNVQKILQDYLAKPKNAINPEVHQAKRSVISQMRQKFRESIGRLFRRDQQPKISTRALQANVDKKPPEGPRLR